MLAKFNAILRGGYKVLVFSRSPQGPFSAPVGTVGSYRTEMSLGSAIDGVLGFHLIWKLKMR